jgi:hypothetical protein
LSYHILGKPGRKIVSCEHIPLILNST